MRSFLCGAKHHTDTLSATGSSRRALVVSTGCCQCSNLTFLKGQHTPTLPGREFHRLGTRLGSLLLSPVVSLKEDWPIGTMSRTAVVFTWHTPRPPLALHRRLRVTDFSFSASLPPLSCQLEFAMPVTVVGLSAVAIYGSKGQMHSIECNSQPTPRTARQLAVCPNSASLLKHCLQSAARVFGAGLHFHAATAATPPKCRKYRVF